MITIPSAYIAAEKRRVRNSKFANCVKLFAMIAAVTAIITYGVIA